MKASFAFATALLGVVLAGPAALSQSAPGQGGGGAQGGAGSSPGGGYGTRTAPDSNGALGRGELGQNAGGPNSASFQDKDFLKKASQGSNFEIKAGQLAQQKSTSDDVKQFGSQMVADHQKLNQQMAPLAAQAGVTPSTGLSKKDQKTYDTLATKSGADFDSAYIAAMAKAHNEDLNAFKKEADSGQLQAEKDAASQGAATVQAHLQAVQQMAQAHNVQLNGKGM